MSQQDVIDLGKEVAAMKRDIANLQGWQKTQTATSRRLTTGCTALSGDRGDVVTL